MTDAEREQTARTLQRAGGEGALDVEELDERLTAAYAAKTRSQLDVLVTDLPDLSVKRKPDVSPSRWWLWAVFAVPFAAWVHALTLTKNSTHLGYAILYFVPLFVVVVFTPNSTEGDLPVWANAVMALTWAVGLIHVLMSRGAVDRERARRDAVL